MMVVIAYDVDTSSPSGQKRLNKVAKHCKNWGQRVQNSVFECLVEPQQFAELRKALESTIDPKKDSLRYYYLGKNWKRKIEHIGAKKTYDPEGVLIT